MLSAVSTMLLVALLACSLLSFANGASSADAVKDLAGNPVTLDDGVDVPDGTDAVSDDGFRLQIPAVGMNVSLGSMNVVDGEATPPGFASAYWLRNWGSDFRAPADGTAYVVMHSLRNGGSAPGNAFVGARSGKIQVEVADEILVDTQSYLVASVRVVSKADLPGDVDVWSNQPNRLVVITCLQNADGSESTENLVVIATARST